MCCVCNVMLIIVFVCCSVFVVCVFVWLLLGVGLHFCCLVCLVWFFIVVCGSIVVVCVVVSLCVLCTVLVWIVLSCFVVMCR